MDPVVEHYKPLSPAEAYRLFNEARHFLGSVYLKTKCLQKWHSRRRFSAMEQEIAQMRRRRSKVPPHSTIRERKLTEIKKCLRMVNAETRPSMTVDLVSVGSRPSVESAGTRRVEVVLPWSWVNKVYETIYCHGVPRKGELILKATEKRLPQLSLSRNVRVMECLIYDFKKKEMITEFVAVSKMSKKIAQRKDIHAAAQAAYNLEVEEGAKFYGGKDAV